MYSEFDVIFGFDGLKKTEKNPLQDLPMNDISWDIAPTADAGKAVSRVIKAAFVNDILGESYSQLAKYAPATVHESPANNPIEAAMNSYFAKGVAGSELKRKIQKAGLDVSEAMSALLLKFQEFFTIHEQRVMDGKIKCLDVPGFLEMLNSKLEVS